MTLLFDWCLVGDWVLKSAGSRKMGNIGSLMDEFVNTLETNLRDPASDRTGSFVYRPEQEINFGRNFPKIQVFLEGREQTGKTFGCPPNKTSKRIGRIFLFTQKGISDKDTGLKNEVFLQDYAEEIQDTLDLNAGSFTVATLNGFGTIEPGFFKVEPDVLGTIIPVMFMAR